MKRKTKRILKNVAIILLGFALVGVVAALINNYKKDGDEINPKFTIGGLDENGEFVETESTLVTLDAFEVGNELKVAVEFDANVKYQVYFYDENDNYLAKTEVLTKTNTPTLTADYVYARVVITPVWDKDVAKDDQVIKWYQINKYSKLISISVDDSLLTAEVILPDGGKEIIYFEKGMTWDLWFQSDCADLSNANITMKSESSGTKLALMTDDGTYYAILYESAKINTFSSYIVKNYTYSCSLWT